VVSKKKPQIPQFLSNFDGNSIPRCPACPTCSWRIYPPILFPNPNPSSLSIFSPSFLSFFFPFKLPLFSTIFFISILFSFFSFLSFNFPSHFFFIFLIFNHQSFFFFTSFFTSIISNVNHSFQSLSSSNLSLPSFKTLPFFHC